MPAIIGPQTSAESGGRTRIVLAHDWLVGMRGGERVLDRLARLFGPTTIYTMVDNGCELTEAIRACAVVTSPLQRLPGAARGLRRWYLPLYRWAVERLTIEPCDLVISSSSAAIKSLRPPAEALHLCYCHSPARYIWGQTDDYAAGSGGAARMIGLRAMRRRYQKWDRESAQRVTTFLANSRHTAVRIREAYDREAQVVYPPVRTSYFTPDSSVTREPWLLAVGALEPYKRIDVAIRAANEARLPLKIIGDGSQRARLSTLAGETVELLGRVDDRTLRDHYRRARALIFPQEEDFGIIAAEAQACGCPVIAHHRGGGAEIVTERTGVLADLQTPASIMQAAEEFDARLRDGIITHEACSANAARFSEERFDREMRDAVDSVLGSRGAG